MIGKFYVQWSILNQKKKNEYKTKIQNLEFMEFSILVNLIIKLLNAYKKNKKTQLVILKLSSLGLVSSFFS